jgi:hypothetical protein
MSAAQPQLLPATAGGTQFELLLLALTARLSQWPQLEWQAEQVSMDIAELSDFRNCCRKPGALGRRR